MEFHFRRMRACSHRVTSERDTPMTPARGTVVLASANPDVLACETIPGIAEARALVRCLTRLHERCQATSDGAVDGAPLPFSVSPPPAWISFACRDGSSLSSGEPFEDAVRAVASCPYVRAAAVGGGRRQSLTAGAGRSRGGELYGAAARCCAHSKGEGGPWPPLRLGAGLMARRAADAARRSRRFPLWRTRTAVRRGTPRPRSG